MLSPYYYRLLLPFWIFIYPDMPSTASDKIPPISIQAAYKVQDIYTHTILTTIILRDDNKLTYL